MRDRLPILFLTVGLACGGSGPKLSEVQSKVFTPSCVFATCHDAQAAGGLSLVSGESYRNLVGVKSVGAPERTRVIAGDVMNSYVIEKLTKAMPEAGVQMPQNGFPLEPDRLQLVKDWISAGAEND
jgi:hypothetical protein